MKKHIWILPCLIALLLNISPVHAESSSLQAGFVSLLSSVQKIETSTKQTSNLSLWQTDTGYARIAVTNPTSQDVPLTITVDPFLDEAGNEVALETTINWMAPVTAEDGLGVTSKTTASILDPLRPYHSDLLEANTTRQFLIQIQTASDTPSGILNGGFTIQSDSETIHLKETIVVYPYKLSTTPSHSLSLWFYPQSSARYYGFEPFSEEHQAFLQDEFSKYYSLGGRSISVAISEEPWAHQTYDDTPSLIRWVKTKEGSWYFDTTQFDLLLGLASDAGITDTIDTFGVLGWSDRIVYYDEASDTTSMYAPQAGGEDWSGIWRTFLSLYAWHMSELGLMENTNIAVDEKNIEHLESLLAVIDQVEAETGLRFNISCSVNSDPSKLKHLDQVQELNLSLETLEQHTEVCTKLIQDRKEKGLKTMMYTCTGHYPNDLLFSEPDENLWVMSTVYANQFDGMLRWAADAWNEDPQTLVDSDTFEAGDTFLFYPGETIEPSYRIVLLSYGQQLINKLSYLELRMDSNLDIQAFQSSAFLPTTTFCSNGMNGPSTSKDEQQINAQAQALIDLVAKLESMPIPNQNACLYQPSK